MSMPLQPAKFTSEHQANLSSSQFRPLMASRLEASKPQTNAKSSTGVHIFSLPIRRIRGLATALNKQTSCEYIFETVGRITEEESPSKSLSYGIPFRLEEYNAQTRGLHLKCVFVDMEDINPAINSNGVYRCVGKFSIQHGIFQCYAVTPCDETDLQLQEIFQMFSDNVIAQILSRN
nr:spermatogenesis associated protein 22 [Hymenolepis microstoma]